MFLSSTVLLAATLQGGLPERARVAWLGDSITHACRWTRYLEDYFLSRYPEREIAFRNCGVGSDRAEHVIRRFAEDVGEFRPTTVFVMLGMNDGRVRRFNAEIFATYRRDMTTILDRIDKIGARAIVLAPTPLDELRRARVRPKSPARTYDQVLVRYGEWLSRTAKARRVRFIDVHERLVHFTDLLRIHEPDATLIPDGVHPGTTGSAIIALSVLAGLGERSPRGYVHITAQGGLTRATGLSARRLETMGGTIAFDLRAHSLPWFLPDEASQAATMSPDYAALAGLIVRFSDLPEGSYALSVGGSVLVTRTASQWGSGVDIGLLARHPGWDQARELVTLNAKRNATIRSGIRDWWLARKRVSLLRAAGETSGRKYDDRVRELARLERGLARARTEASDYWESMQRIRAPKWHHYVLRALEE